MSAYLYDKSFLEKLKSWTNDTNVTITGPEETRRLFEVTADKTNDSPIKLPMICLRRPGGYSILSKERKPLTYDGIMTKANEKRSISLNAIPISISYRIDVYTRYYEEAEEYMRNILFNVINAPSLGIYIPYEDQQLLHLSSIHIDSEVENNSDVPERLIAGQFTRLTLGVEIDDAYLFDVRIRDNYRIEEQVELAT